MAGPLSHVGVLDLSRIIRAAKRSFNVAENLPMRDACRFEQSQTVTLASTDDTKEAQRAFAEKRKPVFEG